MKDQRGGQWGKLNFQYELRHISQPAQQKHKLQSPIALMKLTKINISPFVDSIAPQTPFPIPPSPLTLVKAKSNERQVKKRSQEPSEINILESSHFNDTPYFKEANRPVTCNMKNEKKTQESKRFSQLFNVRKAEQNLTPKKLLEIQGTNSAKNVIFMVTKGAYEENPEKRGLQTGQKQQKPLSLRRGATNPCINNKQKFDHSLSSRENKDQSCLFEMRTVPNMQCCTDPNESSRKAVGSYEPGCKETNPYTKRQYLYYRVRKQKLDQQKQKPERSGLQYSIIKPHEIKSLPLSSRSQSRESYDKRTKDQKAIYLEMLTQIRKKQAFLKQQIADQRQKELIQRQQKEGELRSKIHTSYMNRRGFSVEQRNELRPWEVEGQTNLLEFI